MTLLLLQIVSCAVMTGVIWTIQILHYPTFAYVSESHFPKFHAFHSRNISFIVLPMMVLELVTAVMLSFFYTNDNILRVNLLGVVLIWLSTFFVSVPLHNFLSKESSSAVINRLVITNWLRTILWSARLALLFYFVLNLLKIKNVTW